jgi:predicted flap endonuclease-1-like 5' DNA nuclease
MDRSTRNLSIITLLVLVIFLALNNIARRSDLAAWGIVAFFLLLAVFIWYYDRLRRRGIDDSEAPETDYIEPLVYDHAGLPDSIELVPRNPDTVIDLPPRRAPASMAAPPTPAPAKPAKEPRELEPDVSPKPTADVPEAAPAHSEFPDAPLHDEDARAPMPSDVVNAAPPPIKEVRSPSPPAAPATTVEEKTAAPPPSASAPPPTPEAAKQVEETKSGIPVEPTLHAPDDKVTSGQPSAPPAVATTSPKPKAAKQVEETNPVTPIEPALTTPGGKVTPAKPNIEVSATQAAKAAPNKNDPNLPMKAVPGKPDDLKIIEGIGPKMEKALQAAGINTYASLSGASESQIRDAIVAAGMRFAPSVPTWSEQASYAANGDFVGLEAFQKTLVGGRKGKK